MYPRRRSESESEQGDLEIAIDPKPGELPMSRVKCGEIRMEARTGEPFKTLG